MAVFELVLSLLLAGVVLALAAPRLRVPWPTLLALAGAALAFVPGAPSIVLDPQLALVLFVAPVLLDAAYDASPRDLSENRWPIGMLVIVAVSLTVASVAWTAHALLPGLPWPAAIALGAIVAPPDAAAATAVLRTVKLPHRLLIVLEGESLLNDATALLVYRVAVTAVAAQMTAWTAPLFALSAIAGVALGIAAAWLYMAAARRVPPGAEATLLQFLGCFAVWILADLARVSAILTVVAYAITIARIAPARSRGRARRASYAVWEVAVFVLNVLAFILVGLQLRAILARIVDPGRLIGFALAVLAVTILVRLVWVMAYNSVVRWKNHVWGARTARPMLLPTWQGGVVIAWCGMRGIVTLAAALALPEDFPQRDALLFAAFGVVLGTLVLQGLTLRPLLSVLRLPEDGSVAAEEALARAEASRCALAALEAEPPSKARYLLMAEYRARAETERSEPQDATGLAALRRKAAAAERACILALRHDGRIGDDAFHRVEEDLDWLEAALDSELPSPAQPQA